VKERLRLLLVPAILALLVVGFYLAKRQGALPAGSPPASAAPDASLGALDGEPVPLETVLQALRERVDPSRLDPKALEARGPDLLKELEEKLGTFEVERAFEQSVYAVLADRALARGKIEVSDAEIEALFAREAAAFKATPDGEHFESYEAFLRSSGRSVEFRRAELRRELGLDRLLGEPPEEELQREFEVLRDHFSGREVQLRHILVESESEATQLLRRLDSGANFARLARANSKEKSTAKRGGLVTWIKRRNEVPEPLAALAFRLQVGKPGGPVKTIYGWHVVQIDAERGGEAVDLESTREQLLPIVRKRRRVEFMRSERARAKVESPFKK
jgi:parvulin-like peptidyl-prolyl isomerase